MSSICSLNEVSTARAISQRHMASPIGAVYGAGRNTCLLLRRHLQRYIAFKRITQSLYSHVRMTENKRIRGFGHFSRVSASCNCGEPHIRSPTAPLASGQPLKPPVPISQLSAR